MYDQIVERAKNRVLEGYGEKHHIVPRSEGGRDNEENIVNLSAREHFICHWLLHRMDTSIRSRAVSFWLMARNTGSSKQNRTQLVSSRAYEEARKAFSESMKGENSPLYGTTMSEEVKEKIRKKVKGFKHSDEAKRKVSERLKGRPKPPRSEEHCRKLSEYAKTRPPKSEETRRKQGDSLRGIVRSEDTKKKLSERARNRTKKTCPHCGKIGDPGLMVLWHFDNCRKKNFSKACTFTGE